MKSTYGIITAAILLVCVISYSISSHLIGDSLRYLDNTGNQEISIVGDVLTLKNGGSVDLSPYLDETEQQTLRYNEETNVLHISDGNSVSLDGRELVEDQEYIMTRSLFNEIEVMTVCTGDFGMNIIEDGHLLIDYGSERYSSIQVNGKSMHISDNGHFYVTIKSKSVREMMPSVDIVNTSTESFGGPTESFPFIYDEGKSPQIQVAELEEDVLSLRVAHISNFSNWAIIIR